MLTATMFDYFSHTWTTFLVQNIDGMCINGRELDLNS